MADNIANGAHGIALGGGANGLDLSAMVIGRCPTLVEHRQLAPTHGRIVCGEGCDHLASRLASRQELESSGAELRVGAMLGQNRAHTRTGKGAAAPYTHARRGDGRAEHPGATAHADERERHEV